jgi:hypothetical protein
MIRKLSIVLMTAVALLVAGSSAYAQASNPALQAIVAFANLLEPELVEELRAVYPSDEELARALLASLQESGVIDQQTAAQMRTAIDNAVLPRDVLIVFLADIANGTERLATRSPRTLEAQLAARNQVTVPAGDARGNLLAADVLEVITEVATGRGTIISEIARSYRDAITPRNQGERGRGRAQRP